MNGLALLLSVLGFAALALAMDRHRAQLRCSAASRRVATLWRGAGAALLAASLGCTVVQAGASLGIVVWIGMLSPGALAVVAFLGWRARRSPGP